MALSISLSSQDEGNHPVAAADEFYRVPEPVYKDRAMSARRLYWYWQVLSKGTRRANRRATPIITCRACVQPLHVLIHLDLPELRSSITGCLAHRHRALSIVVC
jgi:hypothetical protein